MASILAAQDGLSNPEGEDVSGRTWRIGFLVLLCLGFLLRIWTLNAPSLWLDEGASLGFSRLPAATIAFAQIDNHPPLFYLIQHAWLSLFPAADTARAPAALIGTGSLAVVMLATRDQVSRRAALFTGLIFAVSTAQIYYSQEIRMYGLLVLGLALACWGALGLARPHRFSKPAYMALYSAGCLIAIYAQLVGLIALAIVGFASALHMLVQPDTRARLVDWLIANLIVLVLALPWLIQIPALAGSYPGLPGSPDPGALQWHLRNAIGYPGLSGSDMAQRGADLLIIGLALAGGLLALRRGHLSAGLIILGLLCLYPLIVFGLSLRSSILHARVFLPVSVAVAIGAGLFLDGLKGRHLGSLGAALLLVIGLTSTAAYFAHQNKPQDLHTGFALIDARGASDQPILACDDFLAAAAWETRNAARLYTLERGEPLRYPGADFWRVLERSVIWYRQATNEDLDTALGGGLRPARGFASLAERYESLILMKHGCDVENTVGTLQSLGYTLLDTVSAYPEGRKLIIIDEPNLQLLFFTQDTES